MDDLTAQHEMVRLERLIETLTGQLAWCAKISVAAKAAIAFGALWFALALAGIVALDITAFVGTVAAVLGGVVLLGSNATTWEQTEAALRETETARRALIGRMNLRVVGEPPRTLH
jgi:hypothetical protein